jgi:uncharacterized protein (DUF4415 family)
MSVAKYRIDPANPPEPSAEDLARLDAQPDSGIDYDELPELDEAFWQAAERPPAHQKAQVTMRLDAETLAFFKGDDPRGYTARMARVLRAYAQSRRAQGGKG